MSRAFISLYLLIVASVVLIGMGLDRFWNELADNQPVSAEVRSLFILLEQQSHLSGDWSLEQRAVDGVLDIQILTLDDFANSAAALQLVSGEIVGVAIEGAMVWYKRLPETDRVMALTLPLGDLRASSLHNLLLLVFYASIALVIYLWVWPLARDVKKLELQTRALGQDAIPNPVDIAPRSTVYPLAQAFNQMTQRLRGLVNSYQEMTNTLSHELRTPLARMKFALAMMESSSPQDQQKRNSIQQDIGEMESLINTLLMYAGFEQEAQHLVQSAGDVRGMLEDLRQRFMRNYLQPQPQPQPLDVDIQVATQEPFCCEWKLMETVVQNLVNNAARYAHTQLRFEAYTSATHFFIAVEDDGVGVAPEARERVFESFVRLYNEPKTDGMGTTSGFGLGLAIVRRIMMWHKGGVRFVEPHYLGGARVELCWPKPILVDS